MKSFIISRLFDSRCIKISLASELWVNNATDLSLLDGYAGACAVGLHFLLLGGCWLLLRP